MALEENEEIKIFIEVPEHIGDKRRLLNNTLRRKGIWIGHIVRRNYLHHDVNEDRCQK